MKYKNIQENWDSLIEKQKSGYGLPDMKDMVVWVACSNTSKPYEIDEEWVGIDKDGGLYWAYASGCSCWDGDYNTSPIEDIKTFAFDHKQVTPENWLKALDDFDSSLEVVQLP